MGIKIEKETIKAIILIAALCAVVYANTFRNNFAFDDNKFIIKNLEIRKFSNIPSFFTEDVDGLYRPMRTILYSINYTIWGLNPFGYHLNSLIFHILNTILVFLISNQITKKKGISLIASLLFATHPLHTERVTNMTAGFDQLGIFFFLLALYFYINFSLKHTNKFFYYSLASFVLALLSSEEAATLPLIILLYDISFNKTNKELFKKNAKIYASFFILLLLYIVLRFFILGIGARVENYLQGSAYITFVAMTKVFAEYILILFMPINLTLSRTISLAKASILEPTVISSILILLAVLAVIIKSYKKSSIVFFSVFWFFITLLPVSNIIPLHTIMAERYLYLPSVGFCIFIAFLIDKLYGLNIKEVSRKRIKIITTAIVILILLFYSYSTIKRNLEWRDDITLWSKTIETSPLSSFAHDNLGFAYSQKGMADLAIKEFNRAIELDPNNYQAYTNLGTIYAQKGLYDLAIEQFKKSIEISPNFANSHNYLALAYKNKGMLDLAINEFNKAIELDPNAYKAHSNLGVVYAENRDYDLAVKELKKAIEINFNYDEAHYNLGIVYSYLEEYDLAKKEFEIASQLDPANKDHLNTIERLKNAK